MKKIVVILGFLMIVALLLSFQGSNKLYAVSGCCKVRDSYKKNWSKNGMSFNACRKENQRKDGDNITNQQGLVWWDTQCR